MDRLKEFRAIAASFHAALLMHPTTFLAENKATLVFGAKAVSIVDYAKREAELFMAVHYGKDWAKS